MLNIKWIIKNPKDADEKFKKRGLKPISDKLIKLSKSRSDALVDLEKLLEQRNLLSKEIPNTSDKNKKDTLIKKVKSIKKTITDLQTNKSSKNSNLNKVLMELPNFLDESVPDGSNESDNVEIKKSGKIRNFDFKIKDHVDIGEKNDFLDFKTATKVSSPRFVYLKKNLAKLERSLASFMLDHNVNYGKFNEIYSPLLVNDSALVGTGQLPKFDSDIFKTRENLWLIPTSEVTLVNLVREKILNKDDLPLRYTCHSPCFRSEAGAAGKDTRGMLRQHQFTKVELVSIVEPQYSDQELERMLECAESILKDLNIHYRVMTLCSGDMGFSAKKTYDIEVWLPGENTYREISSCSNCGDFQSRRMNTRYKTEGKNQYVHTLNGSGLAVGRTLIAILENYQMEDGNVEIPEVLIKYYNNKTLL